MPGEVVVRFAPGSGRAERGATLARFAPGGTETTRLAGVRVLRIGDAETPRQAAARLSGRDDVAWAEPNWVLHLAQVPNDPRFGFQWGLLNRGQNSLTDERAIPQLGTPGVDIEAPAAWNISTGSAAVAVGVVDTGIDPGHPDLAPNLDAADSRNFVATPSLVAPGVVDPADWPDGHGHGSHVAGIVGAAGNNGIGVSGVNWLTRLVAARACVPGGECTSADVADAFDYLGSIGVPVVNASLGGSDDTDEEIEIMRAAMAAHPSTLFVLAAGNGDALGVGFDVDTQPVYPCATELDNVLCVAAIDPWGNLADYSNWGARSVDVAAPGTYIESTFVQRLDPFSDFFESGISEWEGQPYDWEEGEVDGDPTLSFDAGQGPVAEATATLARTIDLSEGRACWIKFGLRAQLSGNQTFAIEASREGGSFEPLPPTVYGAGDADEMDDRAAYMTGFDGAAEVRLRFRFAANGDPTPAPSIDVGAVQTSCVTEQPPGGAYQVLSGTSMATPMVAGVAALAKSVEPRLAGATLRTAILAGAVPSAALAGKVSSNGVLDASRVLERLLPPRPTPGATAAPRPASLGPLRLTPRRALVRPRGATRLVARVRNRGEATARRVRVCLALPARFLRGGRCTKPRALPGGRTLTVRFRVRPTGAAAPRAYKARARATVPGATTRSATATVRIARRPVRAR